MIGQCILPTEALPSPDRSAVRRFPAATGTAGWHEFLRQKLSAPKLSQGADDSTRDQYGPAGAVPAVQCHVSKPPRDLEGIVSGHARTGACGVSPNTSSCPSCLYVKDMSAEFDNGEIVNYRISAKPTFKPE